MLRHGAGTAGDGALAADDQGGEEQAVRAKQYGKFAVVQVQIVLQSDHIRITVFDAHHIGTGSDDLRRQFGGQVIGGALGNGVEIDGEVGRHTGRHLLIVAEHCLVLHSKKGGGDNADAVCADFLRMAGQTDSLLQSHGAHMDVYGDPSSGGLQHSFGHQFPLTRCHVEHFARGTAGVEAIHPFFNQKFHLLLQGFDIHPVLAVERGGHGGNNTLHFFHGCFTPYGLSQFFGSFPLRLSITA